MSKENLDESCTMAQGTRDAIHVPIIAARAAEVSLKEKSDNNFTLKPGSFVKFTNDKFNEFLVCDKAEAHGIINPFIDEVSYWDNVVIFLMPGITTAVRHQFEVDIKLKEQRQKLLEWELEASKQEDPECAGCYEIRNNRVIRN